MMCYNLAQNLSRQLKEAINQGAPKSEIERLKKASNEADRLNLPDYYLAAGYSFPKLLINKSHFEIDIYNWGLIPHWVNDKDQAIQIRSKTLNARGETIFDKPSFRDAANSNRCIVPVNGFYEFHHKKGKVFPHYVYLKDNHSMLFGGLTSEWMDKSSGEIIKTLSIVTTTGNKLMSEIHNNPKATGPRMPLILDPKDVDNWLHSKDRKEVEQLIKPLSDDSLNAHAVKPLSGKNAVGNSPEAQGKHDYQELNEQTELF
jgi:putative SOS response-associated peptidase YedK